MRWMPDGRAVALVGLNPEGVPGVFVQDFVPGRDTGKTRRPLGGFDPDRLAETFGISPNGSRLATSSTENFTNLIERMTWKGSRRPGADERSLLRPRSHRLIVK
jgi:hypothetical protein